MPSAQRQRVSAVLSAAVLGVVLPQLLGGWYTVAALLLLPVIASAAAAADMKAAPLVGMAGIALFALPVTEASLALPAWLIAPICLWLTAGAACVLLGDRLQGTQGMLCWGAASIGVIVLALLLGKLHYGGAVMDGVAADITAYVDGLPVLERTRTLVVLYQSGFARLTDSMAEQLKMGYRIAGLLGVTTEMQTEILNGFRTTLEILLNGYAAQVIILGMLAETLLSGLAGDAVRRKMGRKGALPRFSRWHMPTQMGRMTAMLMLPGLLMFFTDARSVVQAASMCVLLAQYAFAVQGAALVCSWAEDQGMSRGTRIAIAVIGLMMAEFLLSLLGVHDQLRDPRKLRPDMVRDEKDENP